MWKNISRHKLSLAGGAGAAFVLSFIPFYLVPLLPLVPVLLYLLTLRCKSFQEGFLYGFVTSFIVNAGGFYWMVYTIHEFGYLPYWASSLIFLVFCGFGALNFPLFTATATLLHSRARLEKKPAWCVALWFTLGLPALYTLFEYFIPKLFPFYAGHSLYWIPLLTQIAEIPGSIVLSFFVFSIGGFLTLLWLKRFNGWKLHPLAAIVPSLFIAIWIGFGITRLYAPPVESTDLTVALIQANIGSLEKVAARQGIYGKVRYTLDRYKSLTDEAMKHNPAPQLIVWPETAVPFHLEGNGYYVKEILAAVRQWNVPLISGAYGPDETDPRRDYNAAYLLIPDGNEVKHQIYRKNILLAFGEYFPGGETFPDLYKWFPEVSDFGRGTTQEPFLLPDGTRLGVTICYEAIVPEFYRKVVYGHGVRAVVNLTNDSWFGPTTEPYHHGALAVFRTLETRIPLIRVTNTGVSFTVDDRGRMSPMTGVYEEGVLVSTVKLPKNPPETFYTRYGDWFIMVCGALVLALGALVVTRKDTLLVTRKDNVSLPV